MKSQGLFSPYIHEPSILALHITNLETMMVSNWVTSFLSRLLVIE